MKRHEKESTKKVFNLKREKKTFSMICGAKLEKVIKLSAHLSHDLQTISELIRSYLKFFMLFTLVQIWFLCTKNNRFDITKKKFLNMLL